MSNQLKDMGAEMTRRERASGRTGARRTASSAITAFLCLLLVPVIAFADELEQAAPESVGLSTARLQRIDVAMQAEIDTGRKAGGAVLIARHGKIAYLKAFGHAELEGETPLRTDAYFRVYSMTKPVVSVALLMLYEEGKFQLTDPLAEYVPAMKDVLVNVGIDTLGSAVLEPPKRPITIQDVFRHTAGLEAQQRVVYGRLDSVRELVEDKLPAMPLRHHPGERWVYSCAHDVQAYLVERFSGMSIDAFLKERIFQPLVMDGSFYGEPPNDGPRCTVIYEQDEDGRLKEVVAPLGYSHEHFGEHPFGGAGLTMTLMDYARFSQMLLNGGELDGTRILGRKTVELMTANHLPSGMETLFPGFGYGLGVGVCVSPAESGNLGSVGGFGWGGAATTWVIIDPKEDLVALVFAQHMPSDSDFTSRFTTLVYQAIVD
jgi:CubicO group peptidase (beta-lactamase class C family)